MLWETGALRLTLDAPWLIADLGKARQVLSFAPWRPGFVTARRIAIREVRNADFGPDLDVRRWLADETGRDGFTDDVVMLTSRGLRHHCCASAGTAQCVATVGLGNAERIGHRRQPKALRDYGTVNILLLIEAGLSKVAMIETMTLIAEARTAAIIDAGLRLPSGAATGTGTDCIALACDEGDLGYAGKHTDLGQAVGQAVYQAVRKGAYDWIAAHGDMLPDDPELP